jgi:hypothetical protein
LCILKNSFSLFICLLLGGSPAPAQEQTAADKPSFFTLEAVYLSSGAGGTFLPKKGFGSSYRLTAVLANGWGLSAGVHQGFMGRQNEPEAYHLAYSATGSGDALDRFRVVDLCAVRKFWVRGARQQLRLGIEAGPALVHTEINEYSPLPPLVLSTSITPRYRAETTSQNIAGVQVSLNATYLPTQFLGLELALWGNLNPVQPIIGLEGVLVLGRLKSLRSGWR